MQKEKQLVPKLRFPEFEETWSKLSFEHIVKFVRSGKSKKEENGIYNLYGSTGVIGKTNENIEEGKYLLVARVGANAGQINFINGVFGVSDNTLIVSFKDDIQIGFVKEFLINFNLNRLVFGSGQPLVTGGLLKKIKVVIPNSKEQHKIATFLTSIDNQIQTLEKKKTLLEQYKKGILQKIFKQELRFKDEDGNTFPEWEYVKLKEVLKRSKLKNTEVKIKYVLTNSATQGIVSQNDYFDKDIANQNNLQGYYIVEKDDFIYNPRISQFAPVGPLKRNKLAQGVMSPLYTVLRPKKGNLEFLEFYFETTLWHKYMKAIANYGARHDRMNITMTDFENLPIPFPSLIEQIKIANFLSAIDKNIALVNTKIEHTKAYKKGLLQQMFV
jgi:type I restriction enzyme S subunit